MKTLCVSVVQLSAVADVESNFTKIDSLLEQSPPSDLVALPEVFLMRGDVKDYHASAAPVPGPVTERLAKIAVQRRAWLLAGSVIEETADGIYNTTVLFDPRGAITATYRKIHLFEAHLENEQMIRESDIYSAGSRLVIAHPEGWTCGLAVCYDLRFPEMFRAFVDKGADLFFIPSNFTQRTGKDHWETLVRARAIENQCFVVAPNQCGANPVNGIHSYGHSMIVGPWGDVLCEAQDEECVLTAELDPEEIRKTRKRIPVLDHRRL